MDENSQSSIGIESCQKNILYVVVNLSVILETCIHYKCNTNCVCGSSVLGKPVFTKMDKL